MSEGWSLVPLGEAAVPIARPEVPITGKTYRQVGVRLWGEGAYERETIDGSQTKYATLSRVEADDIIVNKIWARNGSVAVVPPFLAGCYCSGEFPTFAPVSERLHPRWFHWLTKTKGFWEQCDEKSRGTSGQNRIKPEQFLRIQMPLPPLPEQRRIVARIDELAAKIEEAKGLRRKAEQEAVYLFTQSMAVVFEASKEQFGADEIWKHCQTTSGGTPSRERPDFYSGDVPWIKSGELEDGVIVQTEEHISQAAIAGSSAKVFPSGTLVIALYGATVGKTGVLGLDAATNQAVCAIFPGDGLTRDYVWWFFKRMRPIYLGMSFGGAQPNISQKVVRDTLIPLPPVSEQRRIVAYLDGLQAKVDALKALQAETAAELSALLPSVLDRAFSGRL